MMWNFFIMFFYEASLEVSMSLIVGFQYLNDYDSNPSGPKFNTINPRNAGTRQVHRILLFVFAVL
jgi:hypothetical protein